MNVLTTARNTTTGTGWHLRLTDEILEPLFVALTLVGLLAGIVAGQLGVAPGVITGIAVATYFVGGFYAVRTIFAAAKEWRIEVDLLMVVAALGAAYVGHWEEGAMLLFLFALSNMLQNYAMGRTRQAIAKLLQLRPDTVTVRQEGSIVEVPVDAVQVGDVVLLRPGDRVALDGTVTAGSGNFDESSLTGESLPVHKAVGAAVLAGTLNQTGALEVRVTKPASESTLSRIVAMVSDAQDSRASTQSFLERAEQWYAIGVLATVTAFILLVPVFFDVTFADNFYRGMVLLTVASPCALVISIPAALLSAIASGARNGVLFKGGTYVEALATTRVVAFDKTGTLTTGRPTVTDVVGYRGTDEATLLATVAQAEQPSEHPIAYAILSYSAAQGVTIGEPDSFTAVTGMGVQALTDGMTTLVGSPRLMATNGLEMPAALQDEYDRLNAAGRGTVLVVWREGQWLGLIAVADEERADAADQIAALRRNGVERIVMLTGDNQRVAQALAARLGIDEVHAELLPEDKLRLVHELRERHGQIVMVGDGVNDAPALAAADVGVAMGGAGTDVALETADVVLMGEDLHVLSYAFNLSRRARRIVWQNISFALAVMVVLVVLTLTVGLALPLGVVGHEGSTILVVLNGLRLLLPFKQSV